MKQIVVEINDEDFDLVESWLGAGNFQSWVEHVVKNKIRRRTDATIFQETNFNPVKMTDEEKKQVIGAISLPTKEQREQMAEIV